jgi:hypothetical protein
MYSLLLIAVLSLPPSQRCETDTECEAICLTDVECEELDDEWRQDQGV